MSFGELAELFILDLDFTHKFALVPVTMNEVMKKSQCEELFDILRQVWGQPLSKSDFARRWRFWGAGGGEEAPKPLDTTHAFPGETAHLLVPEEGFQFSLASCWRGSGKKDVNVPIIAAKHIRDGRFAHR